MLRAGLTGGIATGKSTVAGMMRELGCRVVDADEIAHQMIEPGGEVYSEVLHEFGRGILGPDGRIERPRLAEIVFAEPARLARLNQIVHPAVIAAQYTQLASIQREDPHALAVVEAALLIETGIYSLLDFLIVTWCTPKQQLARLTHGNAGRGLSLEQARQRIAAQMPLEEKRRLADAEVDCSGNLDRTREQVVELVAKLKRLEAERRS